MATPPVPRPSCLCGEETVGWKCQAGDLPPGRSWSEGHIEKQRKAEVNTLQPTKLWPYPAFINLWGCHWWGTCSPKKLSEYPTNHFSGVVIGYSWWDIHITRVFPWIDQWWWKSGTQKMLLHCQNQVSLFRQPPKKTWCTLELSWPSASHNEAQIVVLVCCFSMDSLWTFNYLHRPPAIKTKRFCFPASCYTCFMAPWLKTHLALKIR